MAMLAETAGVSVAYLERLGTKSDIVALVLELVTSGDDQRTMGRAREEFAALAPTLTAHGAIAYLAEMTADWNERSHPLWQLWERADDPDVHSRWVREITLIHRDWQELLEAYAGMGWWRAELDTRQCGTTCAVLTSPQTYQRLVTTIGLSRSEYVDWLTRALIDALLAPPEPGSGA